MIINGFWFDQTVVNMIADMRKRGCQTAGDFQLALRILYPNHRQINSEQDFRDFVDASLEYEEVE